MLDNAYTAASRTSTTSHRSNGTISLYNPAGEAFTNLFSFLSLVVMLSGDELRYQQKYNIQIFSVAYSEIFTFATMNRNLRCTPSTFYEIYVQK